jgi:hypothetical protein
VQHMLQCELQRHQQQAHAATSEDLTSSSPSACLSASFLGPTTLATLSYTSMARTQQHRPYAALDTCTHQQPKQQQSQSLARLLKHGLCYM